jgi:hypothetical protein
VPSLVALQGQFLVRNRRERGGTREMLRGGGWSVWVCREVRVGGRGVRGGVGANAGPGNVDRVQPVGALQMLELRTGLTGRKGRPGRVPGIASRAGDLALQAGIAGAALGASRDLRRHVFIKHEGDHAKRGGAFVFWGLVRFMRSRVFGLHAFAALLRFRPVRPVPPAWHEMPGHACAEPRRPARAVLSKKPT